MEDVGLHEIKTTARGKGRIVFAGALFGFGKDEAIARKYLLDTPGRFVYNTDYKIQSESPAYLTTGKNEKRWHEPKGRHESMREVAAFLEGLLPDGSFRAEGLPEGVVATAWYTVNDEVVIQLLNAAKTLDLPDDMPISADAPIPFPPLQGVARFYLKGAQTAHFRELDGTEEALAVNGNIIYLPLTLLHEYGIIFCRP